MHIQVAVEHAGIVFLDDDAGGSIGGFGLASMSMAHIAIKNSTNEGAEPEPLSAEGIMAVSRFYEVGELHACRLRRTALPGCTLYLRRASSQGKTQGAHHTHYRAEFGIACLAERLI